MAASLDELKAAMEESIEKMTQVMKLSIAYNTETTQITTLLGQTANRAAKQTPQG